MFRTVSSFVPIAYHLLVEKVSLTSRRHYVVYLLGKGRLTTSCIETYKSLLKHHGISWRFTVKINRNTVNINSYIYYTNNKVKRFMKFFFLMGKI